MLVPVTFSKTLLTKPNSNNQNTLIELQRGKMRCL